MTDFSVTSTLDRYIAQIEGPRPPDGLWHPSSLFGCERQAVYEVRGTPQSDLRDNRSRRILRQGTNLHSLVQAAMIAASGAENVYTEVSLNDEALGVTGHADQLLRFADDSYELLEFKSIGQKGMEWGMKKGELPKSEHVGQARTYAYLLRKHGGRVVTEWSGDDPGPVPMRHEDIPPLADKDFRIRIAYFSRDDLRVEEFVVDISEKWERDFEQRMERLHKYAADDTALPPRLPLEKGGKRNWLCAGYCLFRSKCWDADGPGEEL